MEVDVAWEQEPPPIDPQRAVAAALAAEKVAGVELVRIDLALVGDETIHRLNRDFLQHDYPTDVLSFDLGEGSGEVIVSVDTARTNAEEYGVPADHELLLYVVHGVLHIAGLRDKTESEAAAMRRAEAAALRLCGIELGAAASMVDEPGGASS